MEKARRKQNRLPDFDYSREGSYFVTLCTHNRARLFKMEHQNAGNDLYVVPETTGEGNLIIHKWIKETEKILQYQYR